MSPDIMPLLLLLPENNAADINAFLIDCMSVNLASKVYYATVRHADAYD